MKMNMIFCQIFFGIGEVKFVLFLELPEAMTVVIIWICEWIVGSVTVGLESGTVVGENTVYRTGCENMKHSFFLTKILVIFSLVFLCNLCVETESHAHAAVASEGVGRIYSETENGLAVIGILLNVNGHGMSYAYDVWQYHLGSGWNFQYANLNGTKYEAQNLQLGDGKYIAFMKPSDLNQRVILFGSALRRYIQETEGADCFKIETVRFRKGEEISREYEYSDGSAADSVLPEYSLMLAIKQGGTVLYGGCTPEEISAEYNIYTGLRMGEKKDIDVDTDGGTVIREGAAYRRKNSSLYMVETLPEAARPQDKYRYELEGWYTQQEGGNEVTIGSMVSGSTKLYARWRKIPVKYPVTCIDVLKTGGRDVILGTNAWEAEYGENVSGSDLGDDIQSGAYYEGREYTGCSSSIVGPGGATVYRYFDNSLMTVTCIDTVTVGPDTGQQLGNTTWDAAYSAVVSGGVLGCDGSVGAYYKGYHYISSSTQKVGAQGCTVFRYFVPVTYDIHFISNCTSGGIMSPINNCYYGHGYTLTKNSFIKKNKIHFNLNAEDATCDTSYQYVYQDFAGWSDSPEGGVLYSDGCVVASLCDRGGTVKLYAVWSGKETTVTAQPKRPGYEFMGWSLKPEDEKGRRQFLIHQEETLYAIWKPVPVKYHVEYYKQNINKSFELSAQYEFSADTGTEAELENLGELYPGFFLDEGASRLRGKVKADGSLILCAYFRRGEYRLDFDKNGGSLPDGVKTLDARTDVFERGVTIPDTVLYRKGYEFGGWAVSKNSSHVVARPGEEFLIPNHDQTLYAVWIPNKDTPFFIVPYYENASGRGYIQGEKITLKGTTGDTVEQGICACYGGSLERGIRELFGEGCELVFRDELKETTIKGDGTTAVEIYLSGKKHGTVSPLPDIGNAPTNQPSHSMEPDAPMTTDTPQETPLPQDTAAEQGTSDDGNGSGQVSIISTWVGASPDPDEIAAVLARDAQGDLLKKGTMVTKKGIVYEVTSSRQTKRTVKVARSKKSFSRVVIPDSISIKGYSYQVTAIKSKAFAKQPNLKKVVLGRNIRTVGRRAFYGSKDLRHIVVNSTEIKSIGKAAWKGVDDRCRIEFGKECSRLCKKRVLRKF